jgi:hypothetical protein
MSRTVEIDTPHARVGLCVLPNDWDRFTFALPSLRGPRIVAEAAENVA